MEATNTAQMRTERSAEDDVEILDSDSSIDELVRVSMPLRPTQLDGSQGKNRSTDRCALPSSPTTDVEAIWVWLLTKARSAHTFRSYKREVIRLLYWAANIRRCAISDLFADELYAYRKWLTTPEAQTCFAPRRNLRKPPTATPPGDSPRPVEPLSAASRKLAETILRGMFSYLQRGGYLRLNPYALMSSNVNDFGVHRDLSELEPAASGTRQPSARTDGYNRIFTPNRRYFEPELYRWLLCRIDDHETIWPDENKEIFLRANVKYPVRPWPRSRIERFRFAWLFGFWAAPRRSELCNAVMGDIVREGGIWKWHVIGKGKLSTTVDLDPFVIDALMRYRSFLGMPALPTDEQSDKDTPLVPSFVRRYDTSGFAPPRPMTTGALYKEIKEFGVIACQWLAGEASTAQKDEWQRALLACSPHWLRRSYGTAAASSGMSLKKLMNQMRHKHVETTMRHYVIAEEERRVPELQKVREYFSR